MPGLSSVYLPMLVQATALHWPTAPVPWTMAAQVEKETCVTLKHWKCWNPRAELKTSRENGVGLGQITRAYRADGSIRFDAQAELREQFPRELGSWTWEQRYDPEKQLTGIVLMNRKAYHRFSPLTDTVRDTWAFTLSAYNGGAGHVLKDRMLCQKIAGCDPRKWEGNVALHSVKSRAKWNGYGASAYDINRGYVERIWLRKYHYEADWRNAQLGIKPR